MTTLKDPRFRRLPEYMMLLMWVTVLAAVLPEVVDGSPTVFCANGGFWWREKEKGDSNAGLPVNFPTPKGVASFSIGAAPFEHPTSFAYSTRSKPILAQAGANPEFTFKDWKHACRISFHKLKAMNAPNLKFASKELCPDVGGQKIEIRMYDVREDSGRVLNGWLHIEVEFVGGKYSGDSPAAIYLQFRDENFNAFGEFVTDPEEQCPPVTPGLTDPSRYQYIPCTAVGLREAKVAGAIYVVDQDQLFNQSAANIKYLHKGGKMGKGIRFTWRYSEYSCNRHLRFRPEAYILTRKNRALYGSKYDHRMLRKAPNYWILPNRFGAADIKMPDSKLDCSHRIIDDNDSVGEIKPGTASWINGSYPYKWEDDLYSHNYIIEVPGGKNLYGYHQCRVFHEKQSNQPAFGGRCETLNSHGASFNALHECKVLNFDEHELKTTVKYTDYRVNLTNNRSNQCVSKCWIPTAADLPDLLSFPKYAEGLRPGRVNAEKLNWSSSSARAIRYARGRRYHGIMMLLGTMFTSVSIFVARYYKETFMSWECPGGHLWYTFHIGCTVASLCAYGSSLTALEESLTRWGRSTEQWGVFHSTMGWLSLSLSVVLFVFGGFRLGLGEASRAARLALMALHSFLGFLQHFLNLILIMSSTFVHGSPSVTACDDVTGAPTGVSPIFLLALVSLFIDIVFHAVMTVLQFLADKAVGVKRAGFLCPIVPILPPSSHTDMKGSLLRKLLLIAFIALQGTLAFTGLGILATNEEPENCARGNTTCDLTEFFLGCNTLSKRFVEIVKASRNK